MSEGNQSPSDASLGTRTLEVMRILWAIDHGLQSTSKRMELRYGVTGPQRAVLRVVGRSPGITAAELADAVYLHPSTLTGVLRRLAERGLIERVQDDADARRSLVYLTQAGQAFTKVRPGTVEALLRRVVERSAPADVVTALRVLSEIARELNAENGRVPPSPP
jgi:DNA-binding MarR family transcriptional regulator